MALYLHLLPHLYRFIAIGSSSISILTGYELESRGSIPSRNKIHSFTSQRPDRLWGPSSLLTNGYRGFFPMGKKGRGVNLTTHLHLLPRLGMVELYFHSHIRLHGIFTGTGCQFSHHLLLTTIVHPGFVDP
jgi:hypothetical protein